MKKLLYAFQNAFVSLFRYFKYDEPSKAGVILCLVGVAIVVILMSGVIFTFIQFGLMVIVWLVPWLLARAIGKDTKPVIIGMGISIACGVFVHFILGIVVWVMALIVAVIPDKTNIPKDGFI